ncbi:MAG: hypothetical protein ACTHK7_11640 [Aureliella sp.]
MKKLLVLGLLLAMSSGCGRGWFPFFRNGAPCNSGLCSAPTLPPSASCEGCGSGAGYESYGDGAIVGESIGSAPIGPTYLDVPPATMAPLPNPTIVAPGK